MENKAILEKINELEPEMLYKLLEVKAIQDSGFADAIRIAASKETAAAAEEIKKEIASVKKSRKFYDWRIRGELYNRLDNILQNIEISVNNSETAVDLLVQFFSLDKTCCNNCDDSDGGLGYIFNERAVEVFEKYAADFQDKVKLETLIYNLINKNDYACHNGILENISKLLPDINIRSLMTKEFSNDYIIPEFAFALNDAPLFEKLLLQNQSNRFYDADYYRLAVCYLNWGDAKKALSFAKQIPPQYDYNREEILEKIYIKQDDKIALQNLYTTQFMNNPSDETKTKIISSFGEDFFNQILEKRKISVWESSSFSQTDFLFLLQYSRKEAANKYVFDKKDMIDNEYFERDFIKTVKKNCSPLIQSLVIRVPLNFYLNKARSKYYNTAVNHLKYLDEIAPTVTDWKDVLSHDEYKAKLRTRHAKKYSFWEQYD